MIQGLGSGGLAHNAIEAALQSARRDAARIQEQVARDLGQTLEGAPADGAVRGEFSQGLGKALVEGLRETNALIAEGERAPLTLLEGGVRDFGELAATLKKSELAFQFSLEVRNKLIEAYREVMRMSV